MNTVGKIAIVVGIGLVIGIGIYFAVTSNVPKKDKDKTPDQGGGGGTTPTTGGPSDFASLLNALRMVGDPLLGGVVGEKLDAEKARFNANLTPSERKQFIALVYKKKKNWTALDGIEFTALLYKWRGTK